MANIDDELAFLRDANDSSGILSREAIAYALESINGEIMYPPYVLNVEQNGEYEAAEGKAFTEINVNVNNGGLSFDGFVPIFTITKNGVIYAKDFSDKNLIINEFEVNVPEYTNMTEKYSITIDHNGIYEPDEDKNFGIVTVDIPDAKKPGDLVTASMYFFDPNNPNDASYIFIDKDDQILFGDSAKDFLDRFPRFKMVDGYFHTDWNPNPDKIVSDQWYIPCWTPAPFGYDPVEKILDYDIFMYIIMHKLLLYFYNFNDDIKVKIDNEVVTLNAICDGFSDADGREIHYGFSMDAYDKYATTYQFEFDSPNLTWDLKRWNIDDLSGRVIWTDGIDIYYGHRYILDKTNMIWQPKTWNFIPSFFDVSNIWTDGVDTYYSYGHYDQYILDRQGSTWRTMTWNGFNDLYGEYVWTDGINIYYSIDDDQYFLDKTNNEWKLKEWSGAISYPNGLYIWTDGVDIYISYGYSNQFRLNKTTGEWEWVIWTGDLPVYPTYYYIWTDGVDTYHSNEYGNYVLDKNNLSWNRVYFENLDRIYPEYIWNDGVDTYYSYGTYDGFKYPKFCMPGSDLTSETPIINDNYYWWGCSLARALINGRRDLIVRQNDMQIYDDSGWNLDHFIPQTLKNSIIPVSYYVIHPKQVPNDYPYRFKTIPRKNLRYTEGYGTTYDFVDNPTGNPKEQGWSVYVYQESIEAWGFVLTEDTVVNPRTTYYYERPYYIVTTDNPVVSDAYDEKQLTGWSSYELNLRHSPILYIDDTNGNYTPYKKVNGTLVEYTIEDHIKYISTHHVIRIEYLRYWTMYGLRSYIMNSEGLEDYYPGIYVQNMYYISGTGDNITCLYLYDKVNKIYYTFNASENDETKTYRSCHRYTMTDNPDAILNFDTNIANFKYKRILEYRVYLNDGKHNYISEYDIWPDEEVYIWGSGEYFEKDDHYFPDEETGDTYHVYFPIASYQNVNKFQFFNYYDVINGFNTCPPAYYFNNVDDNYLIERVDTQYTGYVSDTVEYEAYHVVEKVTDKFTVSDISLIKNKGVTQDLYSPPYYGYGKYQAYIYCLINTPLVDYTNALRLFENGQKNPYNIKSGRWDFNGILYTILLPDRNDIRNIYADEATIKVFDKRYTDNIHNPNLYPLYDYDEATAIWQECYNSYEKDYTMLGPHNSYNPPNGIPEVYDKIYFYL